MLFVFVLWAWASISVRTGLASMRFLKSFEPRHALDSHESLIIETLLEFACSDVKPFQRNARHRC